MTALVYRACQTLTSVIQTLKNSLELSTKPETSRLIGLKRKQTIKICTLHACLQMVLVRSYYCLLTFLIDREEKKRMIVLYYVNIIFEDGRFNIYEVCCGLSSFRLL